LRRRARAFVDLRTASALTPPRCMGFPHRGSFLLAHTDKLIIASSIANIYARDATATKQGQHSLANLYGGRFLLGLGVSHVPLVENAHGHQYRRPLATMRAYLDAMDKAAIAPPLDEQPPTVLAALGPQMTALAGQRTAGAFPRRGRSSARLNGSASSKRCSSSLTTSRHGK
jgi:alkanesulfonate monooxygenase SsuD/methylene tetrahydromethanopterin reductase-like flavin-dependent oxidoreductase (luciferase family)